MMSLRMLPGVCVLWCALVALTGCEFGSSSFYSSVVDLGISPVAPIMEVGNELTFRVTAVQSVQAGGYQQFAKYAFWSVDEAPSHTCPFSSSYVYTATTPGLHVIHALTDADGNPQTAENSVTMQVLVTGPSPLAITPAAITVGSHQTQQYQATRNGAPAVDVTWHVMEDDTIISPQGVLTGPDTPGVYHVVAVDATDAAKTAVATVTVSNAGGPSAVEITPAAVTVGESRLTYFSATVIGESHGAVRWSVDEMYGGTVYDDGAYMPPRIPGVYHVRATSVTNPTISVAATVTVTDAIVMQLSPATMRLYPQNKYHFTLQFENAIDPSVNWYVEEGRDGGYLQNKTNTGVDYQAPNVTGTYHLRATSVQNNAIYAVATIVVEPSTVGITVTPETATVTVNQSRQFFAQVTGTSITAVTWWVMETGGHVMISQAGVFTAKYPGTFHLVATSNADTSKSAQATITVP